MFWTTTINITLVLYLIVQQPYQPCSNKYLITMFLVWINTLASRVYNQHQIRNNTIAYNHWVSSQSQPRDVQSVHKPCGHHPRLLLYDLNEQKQTSDTAATGFKLFLSELCSMIFRNGNSHFNYIWILSTYQNHEGLSSHYGNIWIQGHFLCPSCCSITKC
jgi:hypothetical protein